MTSHASVQSPIVLQRRLAEVGGAASIGSEGGKTVEQRLRESVTVVADIAAAKLLSPSLDGQEFAILGYSVAGKGAGSFYYDASDSTSLNNDYTVLVAAEGKRLKRKIVTLLVEDAGAVGDGVVNDTLAFSRFESVNVGCVVDLKGMLYLVDAVPKKNAYTNGRFKLSSGVYQSQLFNSFAQSAPKFAPFGGQLANLKNALSNPFSQYVGICFVGDSITWGRTLPENATTEPRNGTLTDARDNFASPSFVNEFKRFIGSQFMSGASLELTNWAESVSGQSTAVYTKPYVLYPEGIGFTLEQVGAPVTAVSQQESGSISGFTYMLTDGQTSGAAHQSVKFNFTGNEFTICYGVNNTGDSTYYDVIVDGVNLGTFSTYAGVDGNVVGQDNRRVHSIGYYVRNKVVEIRTNRNGDNTGSRRFRFQAVIVNKLVRITNQGIIGATAQTYDLYNLSGSYSVPTAVTARDEFIFCQIGTNDRAIKTTVPKGQSGFLKYLSPMLDRLDALGNVVVMCSAPLIEDSVLNSMTMEDIRGVLYSQAKVKGMDFIDNYTCFSGVDTSVVLDGSVHPNTLGHAVIAKNIINSLMQAS